MLDADPDLSAGIDRDQLPHAIAGSIARVFEFERGPWRFLAPAENGALGALVLKGMILMRVDAGWRSHIELLGEGDLISPWLGSAPDLACPLAVEATVASKLRIALLDRGFALRTGRWPEIHAALVQRLIIRSRRLSLQSAINSLSRIEDRLEVTLWELANRFGRVTSEGIALHLPITHAQLAEMVAAQRPSVSTAVGRLQAHGRVIRTARHDWLLRGEPPETLPLLAQERGVSATA